MANTIKEQQEILEKLSIFQLNGMQEKSLSVIKKTTNTVILSPTGTGKTLAFLLPLIERLDPQCNHVQAIILVPTRELAIQIEQVIRNMGTGYKVNAVYGGRSISKDKIELKHAPAILVGTPGRMSDHFVQERFSTAYIKTLVLDEFDKSLEIGFEDELKDVIGALNHLNRRILTSATQGVKIPNFVRLDSPVILNYLKEGSSKLVIKTVVSHLENKSSTLLELLEHIGNEPGIIFCNLKESILNLSDFFNKNGISHGCFHGGMEQKDRERSLIKFRNGTFNVLLATDLAARGIDIPEMKYIIHYQLPNRSEEFTHRNGRTARVHAKGTAYVLKWDRENLPDFIKDTTNADISKKAPLKSNYWQTLFVSGGRKDKISKGDIAGLFFKQGNLHEDQLGVIELKQDCTFVAVPASEANKLVSSLNNRRLKKKKVRICII